MKPYMMSFLSIVLFLIFLWACGGDPLAIGDKAYAEGKYNEALKNYFEAKKAQPENQTIDEKIALCYAQNGRELYSRTKNLNSFVGNIEKAQKYIPENETTTEFNKVYSQLLYQLALGYHRAKAENPIQEEQFFAKTLDYLDEAILLDYENNKADSLLTLIRDANFQKMFDKGVKFYERAMKEKTNGELFLSAEFYIKRASSFDPTNKDAQKYLKRVRVKTLRILDLNDDFPIAIANKKYTTTHLLLDITALNYMGEPVSFDPSKLKIVDFENNQYGFDNKETEKYDRALTQAVNVENRKTVDGNVAFKISKKIPISHLEYVVNDEKTSKKYFP